MEQEEERFYVKNLPPDVTEEDFKTFFAGLGDVHDIVVKNNYGFFSATGSHRALKKASFVYANKLWNGNEIKLEKAAKENFMVRLAKEREAAGTVPQKQTVLINGEASKSKPIKVKKKKKYSSSDDSDDEENKAGVPRFRGTLGLYPEEKLTSNENDIMSKFSAFDSTWADDDDVHDNSEQLSSILGSGKTTKVKKTIQTEKVNDHAPLSKLEKKKRDDDRRRLSLANKSKEKQKKQNLIKTALSAIDAPKAKKFVFGSDEEETQEEKRNLFDDAEDESENFVIPDKEHFEGEKGRKLLKLQSQFNNDDRFKLDERFLDDGDENGDKTAKKLLPNEMVRFDPTKRKVDKPEETQGKRKKLKVDNSLPEASKERFYEVSETLTAAFKEKSSGFSLLAAYGRKQESDVEREPVPPMETKIKPIKKRNPLLVDSSDDDEISEEESKEEPKLWAPVVHIPAGVRDNFFFSQNDPLISEAMEFMNKKNSEEAQMAAEHYDTTRKVLKKLFKDQAMRRSKKSDMFKKKVGGMKKKVKVDPFKSNPIRKNKIKRKR